MKILQHAVFLPIANAELVVEGKRHDEKHSHKSIARTTASRRSHCTTQDFGMEKDVGVARLSWTERMLARHSAMECYIQPLRVPRADIVEYLEQESIVYTTALTRHCWLREASR